MQKNWYIIYTKPKCEKKVFTYLRKRKIECFFPLNYKKLESLRKVKIIEQPLFERYVFANVIEEDIFKITSLDGVVNLVYWKEKPAIMEEGEIKMIKEFTRNHTDIKLEQTKVNLKNIPKTFNGLNYSIVGNLISVKNTTARLNLPSIGYSLMAEIDSKFSFTSKAVFENELSLQS